MDNPKDRGSYNIIHRSLTRKLAEAKEAKASPKR